MHRASQPGRGHPFPAPHAPNPPQSTLGTPPVPHVPGRWQQGRQGRQGTDLLPSRISIIPVPAAWAPLELPAGPVQELRANPGTHSIGATKQSSHENILISRGQRAFFLPGAGSLGRAARPGPWLGGTAAHGQPSAHRGSYHTPKYQIQPAQGEGTALTSASTCYKLTE